MCLSILLPILGFFAIGVGVLGLLSSLYPKCEYPERRLAAPIVRMLLWSSFGLLMLAIGGMIPLPSGTYEINSISLPSPITLLPYLILAYLSVYLLINPLKFFVSPNYWHWRLSSWAGRNRFAILDFTKLHSGPGERPCFRVVLRDASGKERKAEVTLGGRTGPNLNHVNVVWLDEVGVPDRNLDCAQSACS